MKRLLSILLLLAILLPACGLSAPAQPTPEATATSTSLPPTATAAVAIYLDPQQPIEARVEDLLKRMTVEEKIGQMTQVEKGSIVKGDITQYFIGSILSGGGGSPTTGNTPVEWTKMIGEFQAEALETRLKIPMIYGVDAVHGHNNLQNATIFPHNIGLGAANDPALMEKIGRATAEEMLATGATWDFAPVVAVVQDVRWGRTYEGYGEETKLVTSLAVPFVKGLQTPLASDQPTPRQSILVLASPKHFVGDGATLWKSSRTENYSLDQGNVQVPEEVLRETYLPPYQAVVEAGAMNIMASFSSWKGTKMHAQKPLMTEILKGEFGFQGFIVSDWQAIDQIDADYYLAVVTSINAGMDMNMVPYDYKKFIETMQQAIELGDIPLNRVDDAVRRILRTKFAMGLFEHPMPAETYQASLRSPEHLALAREAVQKSLVLLKNENQVLPLKKDLPVIFVTGNGADDIGLQSGGWTLTWQGKPGNENEGSTLLDGIKAQAGEKTQVLYSSSADFSEFTDEQGQPLLADVSLVVLAEPPYAEGVGDRAEIGLTKAEIDLLKNMRAKSQRLVVILLSGRPRVITHQLPQAEAWVAAWLPGTEGAAIAEVLFGEVPFTGKLSYSWPRSNAQLPINLNNSAGKTGCDAPLFPFGYGLSFGEAMPNLPDCP